MGFFKALKKVGKAIVKNPVSKFAGAALPGVGLAVGAAQLADAAGLLGGSSKKGGLPPLPGTGILPAMSGGVPEVTKSMGDRSIFKNDPNVIEALKPFAISKGNLKAYYRAPKGFVIMYDQVGDPYGIPRNIAKQYLGWKPSKKPPISVKDWEAFKRSNSVMNKLKAIEKKSNMYRKSPARRASIPRQQIIETGPGSVKVVGRK